MTEIAGQDGANGTRFTFSHEATIIRKKDARDRGQSHLHEVKVRRRENLKALVKGRSLAIHASKEDPHHIQGVGPVRTSFLSLEFS